MKMLKIWLKLIDQNINMTQSSQTDVTKKTSQNILKNKNKIRGVNKLEVNIDKRLFNSQGISPNQR